MPMKIKDVMVSDDDLNQRFKGTYIEISINKKAPQIVWPAAFGGGVVNLHKIGIVACNDIAIVREFPGMGSIQYREDVHFVQRKPERQWSRGFRGKILTDFTRSKTNSYEGNISQEMAEAAFYPAFQGLESGMKALFAGKANSFAYNPEFWFSGFKKRVYLWFKDVPVGEIQSSTLFCFPQCQHLKQEVKDEFQKGFRVR